jgi:hypothetical protein
MEVKEREGRDFLFCGEEGVLRKEEYSLILIPGF